MAVRLIYFNKTIWTIVTYLFLNVYAIGESLPSIEIKFSIQSITFTKEVLTINAYIENKGEYPIYLLEKRDNDNFSASSIIKNCRKNNAIEVWDTFPPEAYVLGKPTHYEPTFSPSLVRLSPNKGKQVQTKIYFPVMYKQFWMPSVLENIPLNVDREGLQVNFIYGFDLPNNVFPKMDQGMPNFQWRYLFETGFIDFSKVGTSNDISLNLKQIEVDLTERNYINSLFSCNFPQIKK